MYALIIKVGERCELRTGRFGKQSREFATGMLLYSYKISMEAIVLLENVAPLNWASIHAHIVFILYKYLLHIY